MKKLFVLFIILFSLVFVSDAYLTAEATSGTVDVKITALFDTGNEVDFPAITKAYGATVTHAEVVGGFEGTTGYEFVFWVVNGVVDHTLDESATFTVTSRLNLQAVYKPIGDFVVVFVDANGVYLGSKYTEGGLVNDTGIQLPGKPNYTPNGWVSIEGSMNLSSISADSVFMLQYVADGTLPTVNISVTNGTTVGEVDFNTVVTVNPNPADSGLEFSHWTENGKVVSYQAEYKFTALVDRSLTAVYVATGTVVEEAVVTLSNDLELRDGYHTYTGQVYLPAGSELVEYGFLFSNSAVILEYGNAPVKAQSSNMNTTTNEFITSFSIGSHMAMRAYAIYFNGVSNEIVLSDVNHRYLKEVLYNFDFGLAQSSTYANTAFNTINLVDGTNFEVLRQRVSINDELNSTGSANRSIVISPRIGTGYDGISWAEFNFESDIYAISFDAFYWNESAVSLFETFVLQVKIGESFSTIYDIKEALEGSTIRENFEVNNIDSSVIRFYATGGASGNNNARVLVDNLIAKNLYKGLVHDITYDNEGNITNLLVADSDTVDSFTPSKTGYTFNGWYTSDTFDEPAYNFSTPVTTDLTLYAKYTINQYTITFDSNEGSAVAPITQNYGTPVTEPSNPTRLGYTFDGWYTDDNTFLLEYEFTTMTQNTTLYAKWNIVNYDITYNGLLGATNSNPTSYNIETPTINLADPGTREGYLFVGWFDQEVGGSEVESITLGSTGNKTLYARWDEVAEGQVLISYEAYDGEPAPSPELVNVDEVFEAPTQPSKTGYTFGGWYTSDVFVTQWNFAEDTTNVAITLYAKWNLVTYDITYLGLEGASNTNPSTYNIETPTINLADPGTREGYSFLGWFTAASGGSEVESIVLGSTGNQTIYAQWQEIVETSLYTTGFESGEGFVSSTTYNNQTPILRGPSGQQWYFYYGTPSTTGPILGAQSAQMRWYDTAPSNHGYIEMNFTITNVTRVTFKALNTSGNNVRVYYSVDGGAFTAAQVFTLGTSSQSFEYTVNQTGAVKLKFELVPGSTNGSRVTIDDINIFGYQNP